MIQADTVHVSRRRGRPRIPPPRARAGSFRARHTAAVGADFSGHPVGTMNFGEETGEARLTGRRKAWIADGTVVSAASS